MKRTFAAVALILGGLAAFAGSPYLRPKEVGAVQLAQWIKERKPGLRIVDLRSKAEFDAFHVPTSVRESASEGNSASVWPRASARGVPAEAGTHTETVVIANDASSVPSGAYVLHGGINEWRNQLLAPKKPTELTRYFGGVRRGGC